jgi:transcriptional regulator with XRE-family HTH domain
MVLKSETFAQLIEQRMRMLGLNQLELEKKSGISDSTWARWRAGQIPTKSMIPAAAIALLVDPAELRNFLQCRDGSTVVGIRVDTVEQAKAWVADHASHATQPADA